MRRSIEYLIQIKEWSYHANILLSTILHFVIQISEQRHWIFDLPHVYLPVDGVIRIDERIVK
jgi:hypothetical protein